MAKTQKELEWQIKSLQYQKAQSRTLRRSDVWEVITCEQMIMKFLQKWTDRMDDVRSIKEYNLFDLWKRIQEEKERLEIRILD